MGLRFGQATNGINRGGHVFNQAMSRRHLARLLGTGLAISLTATGAARVHATGSATPDALEDSLDDYPELRIVI